MAIGLVFVLSWSSQVQRSNSVGLICRHARAPLWMRFQDASERVQGNCSDRENWTLLWATTGAVILVWFWWSEDHNIVITWVARSDCWLLHCCSLQCYQLIGDLMLLRYYLWTPGMLLHFCRAQDESRTGVVYCTMPTLITLTLFCKPLSVWTPTHGLRRTSNEHILSHATRPKDFPIVTAHCRTHW